MNSAASPTEDWKSDRAAFARLVIGLLRHGEARLGRDLLSTPALDMMLDLYTREEHRPTSLTSLCVAALVPERSALFYISRLVERGLLSRHPDPRDGRRANVELAAGGIRLIDECIDEMRQILTGSASEKP